MSSEQMGQLRARLHQAGGGDAALDRDLAAVFALEAGDYTESIALARQLAARALPGWKLHVGFDASGVLPYAAVSGAGGRFAGTGPTVPLAVLRVVLDAVTASAPPSEV